MVIGVCVFELHLHQATSLKQKRKVIKGLIERVHQRFRVSIAETDFHDLHQRSEIAIAAIVQNEGEGERMMNTIRELIDQIPEAFLTAWDPQWIGEV